MSDSIVHPATGEVLADELGVLTTYEMLVDGYLRSLAPHYEFRARLRERIAELRGPAEGPRPARRTDVQRRVASCPRCGMRDAA